MDDLKKEILNYSYWVHFKYGKDLALILALEHPKRVKIEKEINKILDQLRELK